jgi:hypothetical protein
MRKGPADPAAAHNRLLLGARPTEIREKKTTQKALHQTGLFPTAKLFFDEFRRSRRELFTFGSRELLIFNSQLQTTDNKLLLSAAVRAGRPKLTV